MRKIETYSPGNVSEAVKILADRRDGIRVIAGGTDIIVQVLENKKDPRSLLNIGCLDELRGIREDGGTIRIGALTTHREIERSPLISERAGLLAEASFIVGSPQIKNLGTIGGNVANASPVADTVPALAALGASVCLRSATGERRVPITEFAAGPGRSVMRPDELLVEISFPALLPGDVGFYERLGQRRLLSISKVGVAFKAGLRGKKMTDPAIALGAVAPTVIMAPLTAAFLNGKEYSGDILSEAARILRSESRAITDIRSTESYRNKMAGALLIKGLARLFE